MIDGVDWTAPRALFRQAEATGCRVGVFASGPGGAAFSFRADDRFAAASTVKIPIMIAVYRAIDNGLLSADDTYTLRDDDKVAGSGVLLHLRAGTRFTIDDLLYLMISISDNTATNALIRRIGMETIVGTMRRLGMTRSTLLRPMTGGVVHVPGRENWATPREYHDVLMTILEHRAASGPACEAMISVLEKQQCTNRLARFLPVGAGVRWGSKIGGLTKTVSDVGFVITARGRLVISMYCANIPDQHAGEEFLGRMARAAALATGVVAPDAAP